MRRPWELVSGGPGSSLFRSDDGGDTWTKLTKGLPEGTWGKVGVAASGAKPGRVWALVEAEKGGLFRSDDYGESFKKVNEENDLRQRAWYYTGVYADPGERRHRLGHERPVLEVGRRREELHLGPDAPRRQPRPLDRPRRPGSPGRGERRRRERDVRRREDLVVDRQPADGPVLPGRRRRPLPLPRLRRAAGQHDRRHREPGSREGDRPRGVARRRRLRERLDRPEAGRAGRRLRRLLRRVDHPVRPPDGRGARDHRLAAARDRPECERPEVPHPVERADPRLAARPERPLARRAGPPRVEGRGAELEGDLARPDAERQDEAGLVGRPDHEGQHRRRGLRHDLRPRRVATREGSPLGRDGRRPRPRDARRRRDLEERHAEGAPRGDPGELDRGVARTPPGRRTSPGRSTSWGTSRRTSGRRPTSGRPGRGSTPASPATPSRASSGRTPAGAASSSRERRPVSSSPSTTGRGGPGSSETCRSCRSPTSP